MDSVVKYTHTQKRMHTSVLPIHDGPFTGAVFDAFQPVSEERSRHDT